MRRTLFFPAVFIQFLAILVVTFVIGFTASEKVVAQQNAATDLASLFVKAQPKAEVPVIIKLNVNFRPEGTFSSTIERVTVDSQNGQLAVEAQLFEFVFIHGNS